MVEKIYELIYFLFNFDLNIRPNVWVIKQYDDGDNLYVVDEGDLI